MEQYIDNTLIRSFNACYDPKTIGIPDSERLLVSDWIKKYRNKVKNQDDIIWLICRKEFLSDRDLRLFAVWCARKSFKLQSNVDPRSINACNVAEQFANGSANKEDLSAARLAAWSAAESAAESAWLAARSAAESAAESAESAAWSAAWLAESAAWLAARSAESAAWLAARSAESAAWSAESAQIDRLLTYFT